MRTLVLELARRVDAPRLAQMSRRLIEAGLEPCWSVARIEHHLRHADSVVLAARREGRVVGFAIMQYGDEAAHLNLLAVEPNEQRRGLGRKLVAWLEDTARVAGTFVIRLEVRASNRAALAFYAALGYRETARVRGYYQRLEDAVRLARDLKAAAPDGAGAYPARPSPADDPGPATP